MTLKGLIPKKENLRLKAFIYGPAGIGKTLAALQFPNAYVIDTAKETTRYSNLIQKKNSVVFFCSDPYEILNELYELTNNKHPYQTIVIDEVTTLYQNLQTIWTDKFIEAAESDKSKNSKQILLQDFGFRYWDKVKRDWRRIIDALRNLDMNVIVNAHQKDKYGPNQTVMGITSDSEKNDEYIFDFVFRLAIKNNKYVALTEKQRVLPSEIDPESIQFPKEFEWNYDNLLQFYNAEYLEKPTEYSEKVESVSISQAIGMDEEHLQKKFKKEEKTTFITKGKAKSKIPESQILVSQETVQENIAENEILEIKKILKNNGIKASEFKDFLRNAFNWNHVTKLQDLIDKERKAIISKWQSLYSKYLEYVKQDTSNENINNNTSQDYKKTALLNILENEIIREDQKQFLIDKLKEYNMTVERLLSGFGLSNWEEMTQGGAVNMINNFDVFIKGF